VAEVMDYIDRHLGGVDHHHEAGKKEKASQAG